MKNDGISAAGNLYIKILLTGILVTLILILQRLPSPPPTYGEIKQLKGKERRAALDSLPYVRVTGSVDIDNSVDVYVQNTVDVEIAR